jgi:hypothetical protein
MRLTIFARLIKIMIMIIQLTPHRDFSVTDYINEMFCCPRCSHLSTILNKIVELESGVTILFNIVDSCEQCGQQNIVQTCFHQHCNNLIVFSRVLSLDYLLLQQLLYYFHNYVYGLGPTLSTLWE